MNSRFTLIMMVTAVLGAYAFGRMQGKSTSADASAARPSESPSKELTAVPSNERLLTLMQGNDPKARWDAFHEMREHHKTLVTKLLEIAKTRKPKYDETAESRHLAVQLLATVGAREAIPVFVREIEYRQTMPVDHLSLINGYPCGLALREMGQASVPLILEFLQVDREPKDPVLLQALGRAPPEPVSDKAIELYAWVILEIYGKRSGGHHEAINVVERATARARTDQRTELQRLTATMRRLTKGWAPPSH